MTATKQDIHLFEHAGLGQAPFKLVGMYSIPSPSLGEHNPAAYQAALQAMPRDVSVGSCDYCGTPLTHNFIIRSHDGKKSVVGCDCVDKVGDAGLRNAIKLQKSEARREARLAERQAKFEAEQDEQRQRNGGKTDAELRHEAFAAREAALKAGLQDIADMLRPISDQLARANGGFARDMTRILNSGEVNQLSRNMRNIALDIAAKQQSGSRKNSKAFNAARDGLSDIMDAAIEAHTALYEANPSI